MVGFLSVIFGAFWVVCTGAGLYAVAPYDRFARYPLRAPTEGTAAERVGIEGAIAEGSW